VTNTFPAFILREPLSIGLFDRTISIIGFGFKENIQNNPYPIKHSLAALFAPLRKNGRSIFLLKIAILF